MQSLYDKYGEFCSNNGYYFCYEPDIIHNIFEKIRNDVSKFKLVSNASARERARVQICTVTDIQPSSQSQLQLLDTIHIITMPNRDLRAISRSLVFL
jgi:hypothetical protein